MHLVLPSLNLKMNNRERIQEAESYDILIALRRKKENNRELPELCFRQIVRDEETDMAVLRARIGQVPGIWRIYKTVNKRKLEPARKLLMKHLIDDPKRFVFKIDALWKNCLLQSECKAERNFLIDIDCDWTEEEVMKFILDKEIDAGLIVKTPNGWHVITEELDTRKLQGIEDIEVKRDACYFIERFEIK